MRGTARSVVVLGALVLALVWRVPGSSAAPVDPAPNGITLVDDVVLPGDGRLHELTVQSAALGRAAKVRVLLPADYETAGAAAARYPVLLLLHGAGGNATTWTAASDIEGHTAGLGLIVVMPEGEPRGFYTDWLDGPQLETFHLGELLPWIDGHYRTTGTRAGRAVAGLSMGGFGSMAYAARHPDLFSSAAEFSGAVDIADLTVAEAAVLQALGFGDDRRWGPYLTHEANWRGHNPPDLVGNLRWTDLRLTTGTGVPCPGDRAEDVFLEAGVFAMHQGFTTRLTLAGVPYSYELRPCGTHAWNYWDADVAQWLPGLMARFAAPAADPVVFDHRSTEPVWSIYGWRFGTDRPAIEFVDLTGVSGAGLTARGSGPLEVVSPPIYEPGALYALTSTAAGAITVPVALVPDLRLTAPPEGAVTTSAVADTEGRLRFTLDLGPGHTANQYSAEALAAEAAVTTYFRQVGVTITKTASAPGSGTVVAPADTRLLPATGRSWPLAGAGVAFVAALGLRRLVRSHS